MENRSIFHQRQGRRNDLKDVWNTTDFIGGDSPSETLGDTHLAYRLHLKRYGYAMIFC